MLAALVLLAGCATGAPSGGLLPGLRHAGPRSSRALQQRLQADSPRISWPADASAADEDDDPEDDTDEEERTAGAGEAIG